MKAHLQHIDAAQWDVVGLDGLMGFRARFSNKVKGDRDEEARHFGGAKTFLEKLDRLVLSGNEEFVVFDGQTLAITIVGRTNCTILHDWLAKHNEELWQRFETQRIGDPRFWPPQRRTVNAPQPELPLPEAAPKPATVQPELDFDAQSKGHAKRLHPFAGYKADPEPPEKRTQLRLRLKRPDGVIKPGRGSGQR